MICCKALQHILFFPKYTNVQAHLKRALILLTHMLFHTEKVLTPEIRKKVLLPVIEMIEYNKLSRHNKQIINSILDMCK